MTDTSALLTDLADRLNTLAGKCHTLANHPPLPPADERQLLTKAEAALLIASAQVVNLSLEAWLAECKPHLEALKEVNEALDKVIQSLTDIQTALEFATLFLSLGVALQAGNPTLAGLAVYDILKKMKVPL